MKSKQKREEMVDILQHIHKYVPTFPHGKYYGNPVFFARDQLTQERAGGAQDAKLQSDQEAQKLWGSSQSLLTGIHL